MAFGRKVTIYLADGAPSGIRHVEIANWSGQAVACPRSRLSELRKWPEAERPGVYFLLEKQSAETGDKVYIGESENVIKRLSQQDKNQDFWNEVVVFTSKDEHLTKAHIKFWSLGSPAWVLKPPATKSKTQTPPRSLAYHAQTKTPWRSL